MRDVLAAEWGKTMTARSTRYILGVVGLFTALMLGLAWYFVAFWDGLSPAARPHASLGSLPELLGWILALCMAVFGTLAITSEYASGMIRSTFLAVPRRRDVLAAKAAVVALVTFVASEAALGVTLLGTSLVVGSRAINGQAPLAIGDVAPLVAMGLSTTSFAMIGLGLGAISRSALASVVSLVLLWYIGPLLANHVPQPWSAWLTSLVPGALAGQLAGTGNAHSVFGAALPPWAAFGTLLVYTVVPLAVAMIAITRRDA
jgi:ABC-2 type transport system permease protein